MNKTVLIALAMMALSPLRARSEGVNPSGDELLALRTLGLLQGELRGATDAESRRKIGRRVLQVGEPLVSGRMVKAKADGIGRALRSDTAPTAEQNAYLAFWLVRAMGALAADDEKEGTKAAIILHKLRAATVGNEAAVDIMAALNLKNWLATDNPDDATLSAPLINQLGMKLVPVPIHGGPTDGVRVLFCIHETRVRDFQDFVRASGFTPDDTIGMVPDPGNGKARYTDRTWDKLSSFDHERTHPVCAITWKDAKAFCDWLTQKEHSRGILATTSIYRLPTDHEWSCAAGIGDRESASQSPAEKDNKIPGVYAWGEGGQPPKGPPTGSYYDPTSDDEYEDGYMATAPVMSFSPNRLGLFDVGGNVGEFCEDYYRRGEAERVVRGSSWSDSDTECTLSERKSLESGNERINRSADVGFRIVLAPITR